MIVIKFREYHTALIFCYFPYLYEIPTFYTYIPIGWNFTEYNTYSMHFESIKLTYNTLKYYLVKTQKSNNKNIFSSITLFLVKINK